MRKLTNLWKKIKPELSKLKNTGFFHVFGSSVINKIISFLSSVILVRVISKAEYGVYTYAHNIFGFFALTSGLGMSSATLQICSEEKNCDTRRNIYDYCYRTGILFNLLLALAIIVTAFSCEFPIEGTAPILAAFSFLPIFTFSVGQQSVLLRAELRTKEYSYTNTFSAIITFLGSVFLAVLFGIYGLIAASYIAALASLLFMSVRYNIRFPEKQKKLSHSTRKDLWEISLISLLNNGLSALMYLLDIFVIGIFIPDETVIASYKVATTIPTALYFIPTCIMVYVYPYFARNKDDKEWTISSFKKLVAVSGVINFSIALVLILGSGLVVPLVFGKQYSDAVPCFVILCSSFAISGTFRVIGGNLLVTQRKLKFNLFVAVFSSVFNTMMNVILVKYFDSVGAALATLFTVIIASVANMGYLLHVYKTIPSKMPKV